MTALGSAVSPQQLVPGDPDEVDALARRLDTFASAAESGGSRLRGIGRDGWVGVAAEAFRDQVDEVPDKLLKGSRAFGQAAAALRSHARVLRAAQEQARRAMQLWDEAEAASRAWAHQREAWAEAERSAAARRTDPPAGSAPSGTDPGAAGRARALDLLDDARRDVRRSGAAVAGELHEAADLAPDEPSLLSKAVDAVVSFGKGAGEATWGLAEFAFKLSPQYAMIDPKGYLEHLEGLGKGLAYGAQHPKEFGKAIIDYDTWKEDPARALGHLVPDLLLTVATAGAGGAARGATAASRLERLGLSAERAGTNLFPRLADDVLDARLAELGYDAARPAGKAARWQLEPPYGGVDDWIDEPLATGDRVAFGVPGISGFGVKVTEHFTVADARAYFESLQAAPRRVGFADAPTVRPRIEVYEVDGSLDAASSIARSNPQFGSGGHSQVFVPDPYDAVDADVLRKVDVLELPRGTTRSPIEDPRYRHLDPDLPSRPLDPVRETHVGRAQGAAAGATAVVGQEAGSRP